MANTNSIPGRLLAVTINGNKIQCEQDATLTFTANISEETGCKATETDGAGGIPYVKRTVDSKDVSLSFSNKAFVSALKANTDVWNNVDLINLFIEGDLVVDYVFGTTQTVDYDYSHIITYSGTGFLSSVTFNAPVEGNSTTDIEIVGNGKPTQTITAVTP